MKEIKILFTLSVILFIAISCKKKQEEGFGGMGVIQGKVYIQDTLTTEYKPLANAEVRISEEDTYNNRYNYSVKTNSDGYFHFDYLAPGTYSIYCEYERKEGEVSVYYYAQKDNIDIKDSQKERNLYLDIKDKDTLIKGVLNIHDTLSGQIYPLSGIKVTIAPTTFLPGGTQSVTTQPDGSYIFRKIGNRGYKITAEYSKTEAGIGDLKYMAEKILQISAKENHNDDTLEFIPGHDLLLHIIDSTGNIYPNFGWCIYTNKAAADSAIKNQECNSSISGKTNSYGRWLVRDLIPGNTYYVDAIDSLGRIKLADTKKIKISGKATINAVTLSVK